MPFGRSAAVLRLRLTTFFFGSLVGKLKHPIPTQLEIWQIDKVRCQVPAFERVYPQFLFTANLIEPSLSTLSKVSVLVHCVFTYNITTAYRSFALCSDGREESRRGEEDERVLQAATDEGLLREEGETAGGGSACSIDSG